MQPDAAEARASGLAVSVGATIASFDPATRSGVFELASGVNGAIGQHSRDAAIAALLARRELVVDAFPDVTINLEAVDFDALTVAQQAPFAAARIPDAWEFLPSALAGAHLPGAASVRIGVIGAGIEAGNFNFITPELPHPELDYACFQAGIHDDCPLIVPDANDKGILSILLTGSQIGTHNATCSATCQANRRKVDHGTLMTGIIGAVNDDGLAGTGPAGTNGILAFADGSTGSAPTTVDLQGGDFTGSDVPFQVLYSNRALSSGQLPAVFTDLEGEGAQVILLSLGWTLAGVPCSDPDAPSPLDAATFASVTDSLRAAIEAHPNVLFVASAGNCGTDASNHTPGGMSSPPSNLITVAATDSSGSAAGFTNTGPAVDLAAPGVGVPGPLGYHDQGVVNAQVDVSTASTATPDTRTGTGTSVSAAMAAGVAGLYLSVSGPLTAAGVTRLADAMRHSEVVPGAGLAGVPRLDALAVLQATASVPALPAWALAPAWLTLLATGCAVARSRGRHRG